MARSAVRNSPVNVVGLTGGVTAIAAGSEYTCALSGEGVQCRGQYPGCPFDFCRVKPEHAPRSDRAERRRRSSRRRSPDACVLTGNGGVQRRGSNLNGELGDGTTDLYRNTPVDALGLSGILAISGGDAHTCALVNGGLKCWGWNEYGQLGTARPRAAT